MLEKLLKIICKRYDGGKCMCNAHQFGVRNCDAACPVRLDAGSIIEAGFVQVVRCKDCKHWLTHNGARYGVCMYLEDLSGDLVHTLAEDYCSRGERRREDE